MLVEETPPPSKEGEIVDADVYNTDSAEILGAGYRGEEGILEGAVIKEAEDEVSDSEEEEVR